MMSNKAKKPILATFKKSQLIVLQNRKITIIQKNHIYTPNNITEELCNEIISHKSQENTGTVFQDKNLIESISNYLSSYICGDSSYFQNNSSSDSKLLIRN